MIENNFFKSQSLGNYQVWEAVTSVILHNIHGYFLKVILFISRIRRGYTEQRRDICVSQNT